MVNDLTVVGHLYIGRQLGIDFGMSADIVTAMDEPRLTNPYAAGEGNGFVQGLMRVVGLYPEGVDNEGVAAFNIRKFLVADGLHVGDVDEGLAVSSCLEDIAENGQVVVHDLDGHDMNVAYLEGFVLVDFVQLDSGHTRIAVFSKAVRQGLQHGLARQGVSIDIDFAKLAVGPDIVHAAYMVVVRVGNQDAVNSSERLG